jgi:hypothetical protein
MPCRAIDVDGRTHRYAVVPGEGSHAAEIVLVDLGGPGRSLFGGNDLIAFGAAWGAERTLVFLEEPWSTESVSGGCQDTLSRTYVAWRASLAGPDDLASSCPGLWGWDATHYAEVAAAVVKAIEANQPDARVVGTVGISQGAQRTSWLWPAMQPAWAVIVSPSPRTRTAVEFIERRSATVLDSWIGHCPGCVDATAVDAFATAAESRWAAAPMTVDGRSVPVGGLDAIAAVVAASYGPSEARQSLADTLVSPTAEGAAEVGALSDALLMRYGVNDMAAGQLAYFQELCPLYPGWTETGTTVGAVQGFFAQVHRPCSQFDGATTGDGGGDPPTAPAVACIASTSDDGVTGKASTDEWAEVLGEGALRVDVAQGQHAALDLAAACASALKVGGG